MAQDRRDDARAPAPARSAPRHKRDPRREPALRKCLGPCGKLFPSEGAHNRICEDCRVLETYRGAIDDTMTLRAPKPSGRNGQP